MILVNNIIKIYSKCINMYCLCVCVFKTMSNTDSYLDGHFDFGLPVEISL